jgi:hypothetical protein
LFKYRPESFEPTVSLSDSPTIQEVLGSLFGFEFFRIHSNKKGAIEHNQNHLIAIVGDRKDAICLFGMAKRAKEGQTTLLLQ